MITNVLYQEPHWFASFLEDNDSFEFPGAGTWKIAKKVAEKCEVPIELGDVVVATGVFLCSRTDTTSPHEAIMKIKMQVPSLAIDQSPSPNSKRRGQAAVEPPLHALTETKSLQILTEKGCSSTPKLLSSFEDCQTSDMWVPGGFLTFILMEKLPGETIYSLWTRGPSEEKKETIRAKFKESITELYESCFEPCDARSSNLMWDEEKQKCYIIDLEEVLEREKEPEIPKDRTLFAWWGLSR